MPRYSWVKDDEHVEHFDSKEEMEAAKATGAVSTADVLARRAGLIKHWSGCYCWAG